MNIHDVARAPRPTALSPSRAADFKSCPLKFRFRAIDRIPEPPSPAAARGTLVHSVLEELFGRPADERTVGTAVGSVPELWQRMVQRQPDLGELVADEDLPGFLDAAAELVRTYFRMENPQGFEPEQREAWVEVTVADGVPTRGVIDRIDVSPTGLLRLVDYKTGRSPAPRFVPEAMFQLKFYALMLLRLRGVMASRLRLIYLGDGEIVDYSPDEATLLAFEENLAALWRSIQRATETGVFPPRRSRLCDWCSFRSICPEFGGTPPPYPLPLSG